MFALLLSVYQSAGELRRILRQEWVRGWDGWDEVVVRCDNASSVEEKHNIAEECLIRIARISMDNVHERFMSDIDMQRQLLCGNLHIGKSEQFGRNNACLADSLLQLLMQEHVIDTPVLTTQLPKINGVVTRVLLYGHIYAIIRM